MDNLNSQNDYLDRRKHERFPLENTGGYIMLNSSVKVVNISIGGALIETERALVLGETLDLRLNGDLSLKATAVWSSRGGAGEVKSRSASGPSLTGVRFLEDSAEKTVRLITLILGNNGSFMGEGASIASHVRVQMKKMSEEGLLLESEQELRTDQSLPISIAISDGMSLKCVGRVVSSTTVDEGDRPIFHSEVNLVNLSNSRKFMVVKT